jgi:hypothetical protein
MNNIDFSSLNCLTKEIFASINNEKSRNSNIRKVVLQGLATIIIGKCPNQVVQF